MNINNSNNNNNNLPGLEAQRHPLEAVDAEGTLASLDKGHLPLTVYNSVGVDPEYEEEGNPFLNPEAGISYDFSECLKPGTCSLRSIS